MVLLLVEYELNGAAAAYCILAEDPFAEMLVGHQPTDCELPRKLDGYFFFWAFSAAFVTLPWVSLNVTLLITPTATV